MTVPERRDSPASSSRESASEPRGKEVSGKHSVYTHFPKDRNYDICLRTKITRVPCRKRTDTVVPRAENFGDLITADHKVLSEGCELRNDHRYAVAVQNLATQWIQSYPCKTKTSQETQKSLQKFLEPDRKRKVIYTYNSLEFGKACEDHSWNHSSSTYRTDRKQLGLLKEQCAESRKAPLLYCCNQVWMKIGGQIPWNVKPICETSQIYYLMGRRPMKDVLGNHVKDLLFRLVHWLSIALSLRRTSQESINLERKSYLDCSSDTLRSWKRWTHRKSTRKDSMRKTWYFHKENGNFIFPIAVGRIKPLEEIKT